MTKGEDAEMEFFFDCCEDCRCMLLLLPPLLPPLGSADRDVRGASFSFPVLLDSAEETFVRLAIQISS